MWGAKTKNKAVDVWHSKAMLVDPRKTKIIITWSTASEISENEKNSETRALNIETNDQKSNRASNSNQAKNIEAANQNLETVKPNFQKMESIDETPDFYETTETVKTTKLNIETTKLETTKPKAIKALKATLPKENVENTFKNLKDMESCCETAEIEFSLISKDKTSDSLENTKLSMQTMTSEQIEPQNAVQSKEDVGITEQNLEVTEVKQPEDLNTIFSSKNLTVEQTKGIETVMACEEDDNFDLNPIEEVSENAMFLRVLEKTRSKWFNDKRFAKIVRKMEKGKKLKGKEFEEVYLHIRNYCQYN